MAELADADDSKLSGVKTMGVRIPLEPPMVILRKIKSNLINTISISNII